MGNNKKDLKRLLSPNWERGAYARPVPYDEDFVNKGPD